MNVTHKTAATFTSREFNQDTARAKRAAETGPVFITDRGKPAYVLMSIEEYQRLKERPMNLREALMDPNGDDFDFNFPELGKEKFKGFEFD
jgi:prevent-host-death family protein